MYQTTNWRESENKGKSKEMQKKYKINLNNILK